MERKCADDPQEGQCAGCRKAGDDAGVEREGLVRCVTRSRSRKRKKVGREQ